MLLPWRTAASRTHGAVRAMFRLQHRHQCTSEAKSLDKGMISVLQSKQKINAAQQDDFNPDEEFKPPTAVTIPDRFDFIRRVGRGGFGRVLLVREKSTGGLLTMKRVRPNDTYALEIKERMALKHPFVVQLVEGADEGADRVLLFEFCDVGSFAQIMLEDVVQEHAPICFAQLVLALEYLHAQGIVHRDIKPENMLVDGDGSVKLGDLGLAMRVGHSDKSLCGTMAYMPPEMVLTQHAEPASDWWSAGCCLFEMISGTSRLPFGSNDDAPADLMMKIAFKDPEFPPGFDPVARDLVSKLLVKDLKDRLSDPVEIKAHPYFAGVDWEGLMEKECAMPDLSKLGSANYCRGLTQSISFDMTELNNSMKQP